MLSFDDTVIETIEEIIKNVFEDTETAEIIFQYLNESSSKALNERVQNFTDTLPKILGEGHVIIEDLILETLYSKCGLDFVWKKDYTFADYITELEGQIEREKAR